MKSPDKTPLEIAEEQAEKDRDLLEKLQHRVASAVLAAPNRAQRRHRAVDPKKMSSTVARARRKIRARIEKRSRARNRA